MQVDGASKTKIFQVMFPLQRRKTLQCENLNDSNCICSSCEWVRHEVGSFRVLWENVVDEYREMLVFLNYEQKFEDQYQRTKQNMSEEEEKNYLEARECNYGYLQTQKFTTRFDLFTHNLRLLIFYSLQSWKNCANIQIRYLSEINNSFPTTDPCPTRRWVEKKYFPFIEFA